MTIRKGVAAAGAAVLLSGFFFVSPSFAQGANDSSDHPYVGDCVEGVESQNGVQNGNAYAWGRPDAGCVGKADDKNPPGQYPDGSDANNGYECDGNEGIGPSNPAHTGCEPVQPPV